VFGFVPLSAPQIGTVIAIVVGYIAATEGAKAMVLSSANQSGTDGCGSDALMGGAEFRARKSIRETIPVLTYSVLPTKVFCGQHGKREKG